ncbi:MULTISPECIES: ferredoxin reductase family protein [unclassified Curtobacterium]|uniref:ferredoxin reductase family protein n=1 Tax=unclassified Curtobacterium TaxID=257496 RepID=UPI00188A1B45|nr:MULTISPECIES: ferredoxin reductase family protein [unclassified Curtobacterium]MBF4591748.1 ferric reductase-like transmembrane domain-containing protein [Curtobacterium sp. VKM Ac-1395]MCY1692926.1 ferredoxin reductase family protein [Curtobacterium sp. SL109]
MTDQITRPLHRPQSPAPRLPSVPSESLERAAARRRRDHRRRSAASDSLGVLAWASAAMAVALYLASPGSHTVSDIAGWLTAAGIVAGLVATDLCLVMIVLAARVPLVDRVFGSDNAIAQHRSLGKPVLYLLLAHGALLTLGYGLSDRTNPVAETMSLFMTVPDMPLAYLSLGLFLVVVVTSVVSVRRHFAHEAWHVIHLLSYVAVGVALPHMLSVGSVLGAGTWQRGYWIALYSLSLGLIALFRFVMPVVVTLRHRIRVLAVEQIAPGVVSIHLAGTDLDRLGVRGGQYGVWRFWTAHTWYHAHPVSFSAVPTNRGARITVRDLGAGTARLGRIRPGAFVSLEGPYGLFTTAARTAPHLALVASGIGITPVRSLLEDTDLRPGEATVLLRGSDADQQYLWNEVADLAEATGSALFAMVGPRARSRESWMTEEDLRRGVSLRTAFPHLLQSDLYVCGPRAWSDLVVAEARRSGVPEHQIHQERFES